MFFFESLPEPSQLVRPEIGKDFSIHVNHRRQSLARELNHFVVSGLVSYHVNHFKLDVVIVQPMHGTMAPATVGLDKQANTFRFHIQTLADTDEKSTNRTNSVARLYDLICSEYSAGVSKLSSSTRFDSFTLKNHPSPYGELFTSPGLSPAVLLDAITSPLTGA